MTVSPADPGSETAGGAELRARIAGLVCVALRDHKGGDVTAILAERERYPWGGYTFFGGELDAVRSLIGRLDEAAGAPLLLASDLERGLGQQLAGGTSFPPPMALGAAADPGLAYEVGHATAREAAAVGFNCVFAPVLDLANEAENPIVCTRSFGDDPDAVGAIGAAMIRGLQDGGVLATAKHFPGHGRTRQDSHEVLPTVRATSELLRHDLLPFRRAVEADVALVMSAHVAFPELEARRGFAAASGSTSGGRSTSPSRRPRSVGRQAVPATISPAILTGILRDEMGFRGAVVSDALIMGAVAEGDLGDTAATALSAGVDCLLYPPEPQRLVEALARRIESGSLPPSVLARAARRLRAALRRRRGGASAGAVPADGASELARQAAARAIVRVGEPSVPHGSRGRSLVLVILDGGITREEVVLAEVAAAPGREFRWVDEQAPVVPADLDRFDAVHVAWFSPIQAWKGRSGFSPQVAEFVTRVLQHRSEATLISFSSPFILASVAARNAILAFGDAPACQAAVGEVLSGRESATGRLPVRV